MTEEELIEALADKEHASWARWMNYLFSRCELHDVSSMIDEMRHMYALVFPKEDIERWKRQASTPYAELSEAEKQSDRNEVAHILPIIKGRYE